MDRKNRNKGFTLVELLITVVILAIVVAPFLAAFVYASGTNLNASKKQDAANLAEDIAEEIKGKSLAALEGDSTLNFKQVTNPTTGKNEYKMEIKGSDLPNGIWKNFRAIATLSPAANAINNPMPTCTDISGADTMLLMTGFYLHDDKYKSATSRKSTITLDKSVDAEDLAKGKYYVELKVEYIAGSTSIGTETVSKAYYPVVPSVFAIYTSKGTGDELYFNNELFNSDMEEVDGNMCPAKFFLSVQDVTANKIVNSNIHIYNAEVPSGVPNKVNIEDYINSYMDDVKDRLIVYTDAVSGSSLVENIQSDKLYNLEVVIEYKTTGTNYKQCARYVTSKLNVG